MLRVPGGSAAYAATIDRQARSATKLRAGGLAGSSRRARIGRLWIGANLIYGCLRILVVGRMVAKYGVDTRVFAAIELTASLTNGIAAVRLVDAVVGRRHRAIVGWGLAVAAAYLASDLYVLWSGGGRLPKTVFVVLGVWISVATSIAARSLARQIQHQRRVVTAQ